MLSVNSFQTQAMKAGACLCQQQQFRLPALSPGVSMAGMSQREDIIDMADTVHKQQFGLIKITSIPLELRKNFPVNIV